MLKFFTEYLLEEVQVKIDLGNGKKGLRIIEKKVFK
jgi:hypothetical protein